MRGAARDGESEDVKAGMARNGEGQAGKECPGSPESDTAKQPARNPKGISPAPTGEQQIRSGPEGLSDGGYGRFENRQLKK